MIRPLTCLAFLLACGSGLYVYQSKHRVKLLDDRITQTIRSTDVLREQTRMLSAEWTLLNDPERLRQLATQFLTLQTVSPNQFTSLADLDGRLPPPAPPGPPPATAAELVAAAAATPGPVAAGGSRTAADEAKAIDARPPETRLAEAPSPATPKEASHATSPRGTMTASAEPARIPDSKPIAARFAPPPRPIASQPRPAEQHAAGPMLADVRPMVQTLRAPSSPPMPQPVFQPAGSLLGMAHGMAAPPMPLPRPMPIGAPQWSSGAGG